MRWSREPSETIIARALREQANAACDAGTPLEALAMYGALSDALPTSLDARQRVGDVLVAMGEFQRAAQVYATLARHAAHAGYPLRAVVAIKALADLEPSLGQLLDDVAALYGRESTRLGHGARTTQPQLDQAIDMAMVRRWSEHESLLDAVTEHASTYRANDWVLPQGLFPIPLLSLLGTAEFAVALQAVRLVRKRAGEAIITQGEPGKSFFVLAHGTVRVTATDGATEKELARMADGATFGEMALLSTAPRSATVTAVEDCDLLEFDREALASASAAARELGTALLTFARERLLNNVMRTSGIFQALDFEQQRALFKYFTAVDVLEGERIIEQGQASAGLYVVLRGSVAVTRQDGDTITPLARLGMGEMFGEIAILNDAPTTASVHAAEPSAVLFLARAYVERLMAGVPAVREHIEQVGGERIQHTFSSVPRAPSPPAEEDVEIFI